MTYVLILFVLRGGYGVAMTTHEFGDEQACIVAGKTAETFENSYKVEWRCTPKGSSK